MEYIIIALLLVLILLAIILLTRQTPAGNDEKAVRAAVSEGFVTFQSHVQQTMDSTRKEVESSKNVLSENTIKTLETIKEMEKALQNVMKHQAEAQDLGRSLKYLLQSPKLRGNYGEEVLEEMLDRILPKGIWERQYAVEGREQVDAVVKFRDIVIPIDAKFPRDYYERYLETDDEARKRELWRAYEDAVKKQMKDIKAKYIKPEKGTSEFALMFIPSEAIYYETIAATNDLGDPNRLYEIAQEHRVIPVSPNTFYAFLQIIMTGVRNLELVKNAKVLQESLAAVRRDYDLFYRKIEDVGDKLEKASESFRISKKHIDKYKKDLDTTLELELPDQEQLPG